jgi:hypothetical protein
VLKTRKQTPLLVIELSVQAALFLVPVTPLVSPIEGLLLAGIDAAGDPAQQNQPFDPALQVVGEDKFVRCNGSLAIHARIITRCPESWSRTEAG